MKVRYGEGLAIRVGPEPCVGTREGVGEASVGERAGQPLSYEKMILPGCRRLSSVRKAIRARRAIASVSRPGVVEDPGMYGSSVYGNRENSCSTLGAVPVVRIGEARSRSR